MKRALVYSAAGLAAGALMCAFHQYVFDRNPGILSIVLDKKGHRADYYKHLNDETERLRQERHCLRFTQYSADGTELRGFYYPCGDVPGKKIVFIVHGYRSDHADAAGMYRDCYRERGFDLFCCDHRAAGESGGRFIGYDVFESEDCLNWISFLRRRFGNDIQLILHGFSMGGATALKMSDRVPENVRFIVSDSGFSDMRPLLKPRLGPLFWPLRIMNRVLAGYDFSRSDVRPNLKNAVVPILFFHGSEDRTVPTYMGEQLYQLCPTAKDILIVEGARHVESYHCAPAAYEEKLDKFIERFVR